MTTRRFSIMPLAVTLSVIITVLVSASGYTADTPERISIAYCNGCVPFHFTEESGQPAGIMIDLWRLWSEKTGIAIDFQASVWDETLKKVGSGAVDAHAGLFFNKERDEFLDYGTSLTETATHYFSHKSLPPINRISDLADYKVGVIAGDFVEGYLKDRLPHSSVVPFSDYNSLMKALQNGSLLVFAADTPTSIFHLKKTGLISAFTFVPEKPLYKSNWFVAVKEGDKPLIEVINRGMALINEKEKLEINRHWLGDKEEKGETLVIGIDRDYPPLTFVNTFGRPSGLLVDLWRTWAKETGRQIKFRVSSWSETLEGLKNGDTDIHSGLSFSKEREELIGFSTQIYETFTRIYHRVDDPQPAVIREYGTDGVGVMSGSYQEAKFREVYPNIMSRSLATTDDLINALLKGEVKAVVQEEAIMEATLDRLGLHGDITSRTGRLFPSTIYAGILKGNTDLLQEINDGLLLIPRAKLIAIEKRWIRSPEARFYQPVPKSVKLSAGEEAWLKAHPVIRVHNEMEWAPFNFFENSRPKGFSIDYMNLLASKLGIVVQYKSGPTWNEFIDLVKNKDLDVMLNIAKSPEREKFLAFTHQPYVNLMQAIYTRDDQPLISSIEDLYGKTFAIAKGFYLQEILEKHSKIKIYEVSNTTEAIQAVSLGTADVLFDLMPVVNYITNQLQVTNLKIGGDIGITEGKPIPLHIGMRKDFAPFADILEKAMKAVTDDELRVLRQRWLESSKTATKTIDLTEEERKWLKDHPVLRVAPDPDYPPIEFFDTKGRYQGVAADFMRLVAERLGVRLEALKKENWTAVLDALRNGEVDFLPANTPVEEFKKEFIFTDTYYEFYDAIITHEDVQGSVRLEDLGGKEVLVAKDWPEEHILRNQYPDIKVVTVESTLEGVTKVAFKEYDYLFAYFPTAAYLIREQALPGLRVAGIVGEPVGDAAMFRKDSVMLRNLVQKGLKSITEEERRTIKSRWIPSVGGDSQDASQRISLTKNEQAYIKAHPQLSFGIDAAWPPLEFLDQDGKYSGISSGVTEWVAKISGIELKPEKGLPWSDVLKSVRSGELKMIAMIVPTPERAEYLDFTEPYVSYPSVILTRDDAPFISGLSGLDGVRTGVGKGYSIEEHIRTNYPAVELIPRRDVETVLKELSAGKTEAAVVNLAVATYIISKLNLDNIKIAAPTEFSIDLAFGVQKGETVLRGILQKSLNAISEDEMAAIKNRWVALKVTFGLDLKTILVWAVPIGIGLVLIVLFVVTWNRRLSVEVTERKKKEKLIALGARISQLLTKGDTLRVMLQSISDIIVNELSVVFARFWIVDEAENKLILQASSGLYTHIEGDHQVLPIGGGSKISRVVSEQRPSVSNNIPENPYVADKEWAREQGLTAFAGIPMIVEGRSVGAMVAFSREPIDEDTVNTLLSVADSIAMAIERKKDEEQIRKLSNAVEQSPVWVIITDTEGTIEYVNSWFTHVTGYLSDEVIGKNPNMLGSGKTTPEFYAEMWNQIIDGNPWNGALLNRRKNGELFWAHLSISTIRDPDGNITHFIGLGEDITEQKALQEERDDAFQVISSSIEYATNIQGSILPDPDKLKALFTDYFVLWEPRDRVGGDIYFMKPWGLGKVFALGDCTGHGVPGAFMTLIANGALEEATLETPPGETGMLLQRTHQLIQEALGQEKEKGTSNDGMEMGVCYLAPRNKKMVFAGARFSLFTVENGEVSEIKGDKKGLGYRGIPHNVSFTNHDVPVVGGPTYYMTTDGFIDQIGGEKRRSFGKRRFKNLILELEGVPMDQRRDRLFQALVEYQGDEKRRDDLAVAGFTIT